MGKPWQPHVGDQSPLAVKHGVMSMPDSCSMKSIADEAMVLPAVPPHTPGSDICAHEWIPITRQLSSPPIDAESFTITGPPESPLQMPSPLLPVMSSPPLTCKSCSDTNFLRPEAPFSSLP